METNCPGPNIIQKLLEESRVLSVNPLVLKGQSDTKTMERISEALHNIGVNILVEVGTKWSRVKFRGFFTTVKSDRAVNEVHHQIQKERNHRIFHHQF